MNCVLEHVEKRLLDTFHLWMRTSDNYFSPEEFRISLNSTIQELRNITFILQKNKSLINDFENWYAVWQDKMRKDYILKWLVDSRNKIVKQGDLETNSIAIVSVIYNWYEPSQNELSVQPNLDSKSIASFVIETIPTNKIPRNSILKIERRWVDSELKDKEILEALIHCFSIYAELLFDAHNHIEEKFKKECQFMFYYDKEIKTIKSEYQIGQDFYLTTYLDLNTKEQITPKNISQLPSDQDFKKVEAHYDFLKNYNTKKKRFSSLVEDADYYFDFAKNILLKDGYHLPTVILGNEEGEKEYQQLRLDNKRDSYLAFRRIAKIVEAKNFTNVISIGETWAVIPDSKHPDLLPGDYPDKMEALLLVAIEKSGKEFSYISIITRENDKLNIGPKKIVNDIKANFLNPIKEVWEKVT